MTYTDFVSTLNHRVKRVGFASMVDDARLWFTPEVLSKEMLAYAVGFMEYCCDKAGKAFPEEFESFKDFKLHEMKYPKHVEVMRKCLGDDYVKKYEDNCIETFKRHNVCAMEVGNVV
ncbi:MAG: hypothetical protein NC131_17015 [Roseburia sp.]|nr:hypothetical protein [Roseburia sp.]